MKWRNTKPKWHFFSLAFSVPFATKPKDTFSGDKKLEWEKKRATIVHEMMTFSCVSFFIPLFLLCNHFFSFFYFSLLSEKRRKTTEETEFEHICVLLRTTGTLLSLLFTIHLVSFLYWPFHSFMIFHLLLSFWCFKFRIFFLFASPDCRVEWELFGHRIHFFSFYWSSLFSVVISFC